jgi:ferrous iron transport protein A
LFLESNFNLSFDIQHMLKRLSEIQAGKSATIRDFEKDDLLVKLMEMGFLPGEIVRVEHIAPFGDPIAIFVSGYHLSLRKNEAAKVIVEEI